jgi:hypothetical protein
MTGTELIVATPWAIFGLSLTTVCLRLRRSGRLSGRLPRDGRLHRLGQLYRRTTCWFAKDRHVSPATPERSSPERTGEQPGSD